MKTRWSRPAEDRYLVGLLEDCGCLMGGALTTLGDRVAMIQRANAMVKPSPDTSA